MVGSQIILYFILKLLLQKVCSGLQSHVMNESSVNMHYKVTKNVIEILSSVLQLSILQVVELCFIIIMLVLLKLLLERR